MTGTPKERVQIIRDAMRKAVADSEFSKEFHKLMSDDPNPLGSKELEEAIKELPRDKEVRSPIKNSPAQIRFQRDERDRLRAPNPTLVS